MKSGRFAVAVLVTALTVPVGALAAAGAAEGPSVPASVVLYFNPDSTRYTSYASDSGGSAPPGPALVSGIFYEFCWPPTGGETAQAGGANEGTFEAEPNGVLTGQCSRTGARGGTVDRHSTLSGTYDLGAKTVTFHMEGVETVAQPGGTTTRTVVVDSGETPIKGDRAEGRASYTYTCAGSVTAPCGIARMAGTVDAAVIFPDAGEESSATGPKRGRYPANTAALPFPQAENDLKSLSNGCGSELFRKIRWLVDVNKWRYTDPKTDVAVEVDFSAACDLHDAGYSGGAVADPINGGYVDYFGWTRKQIDLKFLDDLRKLCDNKIPASAPSTRRACKGEDSTIKATALDAYKLVRTFGADLYIRRPELAGKWYAQGTDAPEWVLKQNGRKVTGDWRGGPGREGLRSHYEGVIISADTSSAVKGIRTNTEAGATQTAGMILTVAAAFDGERFTAEYPYPNAFEWNACDADGRCESGRRAR